MSDFNFITVEYEEFVPNSYKAVHVKYIDGTKKEYSTGDVVLDFKTALDESKDTGDMTVYSSTVDSFLMDNDGYGYDDDNYIVRI